MDRFHAMSVFLAVAEEQSFAKGARRLGLSAPAVTRAIALLENRLGTRLLTRTTRFVRATDAGVRYLESARRILSEADEADENAAGSNATARGQLGVTAPALFGRLHVMPAIREYLGRNPDVQVSALLVDRMVNLLEEGFDVGVRIGDLPDSTMRAIPVGSVRRITCAAPAYLRKHHMPQSPRDLTAHSIVAAAAVSPTNDWRYGAGRHALTVKVRPRLVVTNNDAAIEAALAGFGITRVMSYQAAPYIAARRLTRILVDDEPPALPIHVLHQEGRQVSGKVRNFLDVLVQHLRAQPALANSS